jgi:hypothetical protein
MNAFMLLMLQKTFFVQFVMKSQKFPFIFRQVNTIKGVHMKCQKCNGFMSYEKFYNTDLEDNFLGFRCVHCGEIIDSVILRNRLRIFNKEPGLEMKFRRTGRGRDSRKRQHYGVSANSSEWDWTSSNLALADRYGLSETWVSQLRVRNGHSRYNRVHDKEKRVEANP